jgi:hypothetical protein
LADAGFVLTNPTTGLPIPGIRNWYQGGVTVGLLLSNWVTTPTFQYIPSFSAPDVDPTDDTLWYYSDATTVDIMIQNNGALDTDIKW